MKTRSLPLICIVASIVMLFSNNGLSASLDYTRNGIQRDGVIDQPPPTEDPETEEEEDSWWDIIEELGDTIETLSDWLDDPKGQVQDYIIDDLIERCQSAGGNSGQYCEGLKVTRCMMGGWSLECHENPMVKSVFGGGSGDPHLIAYSGANYDFMAYGDFIYTDLCEGSQRFQVQARHMPVGNGFSDIGAAAVKIGEDFTIEVYDSMSPIYINGQEHTLLDGIAKLLINGSSKLVGMLVMYDHQITIIDFNGAIVLIDRWTSSHMDLWVYLSLERDLCEPVGLLGDPKGIRYLDGLYVLEVQPKYSLRDEQVTEYISKTVAEDDFFRFVEDWLVPTGKTLFSVGSSVNYEKTGFNMVSALKKISDESKNKSGCNTLSLSPIERDNCYIDTILGNPAYLQSYGRPWFKSSSKLIVEGCKNSDISITSTGFSSPNSATAGDVIQNQQCTATFANEGKADTGTFSANLYLSIDRLISSTDLKLNSNLQDISTLTPGNSYAIDFSGAVFPESLTAGPYYIGVIGDEGGKVTECNEENNTATKLISISAKNITNESQCTQNGGLWTNGKCTFSETATISETLDLYIPSIKIKSNTKDKSNDTLWASFKYTPDSSGVLFQLESYGIVDNTGVASDSNAELSDELELSVHSISFESKNNTGILQNKLERRKLWATFKPVFKNDKIYFRLGDYGFLR